MIEKKYKDLKGYSDKNTFYQMDTYENQSLWSAKNRYIYDMSFKLIPGKTPNESRDIWYQYDPLTRTDLMFTNLSPFGGGVAGVSYGEPGGGTQFITDAYPTIGNYVSFKDWQNFDYSVNNDEGVFVYNENVIGFTDAATTSLKKENWVDFFRSGYIEFSIKTTKQNCIIASGTSEVDADNLNALFWIFGSSLNLGTTTTELFRNNTAVATHVVGDDFPNYTAAQNFDGALINLNIGIKNGKIFVEYYDEYNRDNVNFSFVGNENIADNEWHHIVINFGRPGQIKKHGQKFNKKFIEIWVDSNLDKRFDEKVNEYQIFYPTVKWLFTNIKDAIINVKNDISIEDSIDYHPYDSDVDSQKPGLPVPPSGITIGNWVNKIIGIDDLLNGQYIFRLAVNNNENKKTMFAGSMHTFAHGVNHSLESYEIQKRYSLWNNSYRTSRKSKNMIASATMIEPNISTQSKKILKLYWDNLIDNNKFGIQVDSKYQTETFSVINKISNSKTEVFNFDKIIKKDINILKNVRIAFTDNVLILGPGKFLFSNTQEAQFGLDVGVKSASQLNPKNKTVWDPVGGATLSDRTGKSVYVGPRTDLAYSNIIPNNGDRILLTGQINTSENGIWIWNGIDNPLTRPNDALINNDLINIVYVADGKYAKTYWKLEQNFESIIDPQRWNNINTSDPQIMQVAPINIGRWQNNRGEDRLINLQEDINLSKYDSIVFMNYPESNDDIFNHFPNENHLDILKLYDDFIKSLKLAVANGSSLYVSSPRLALDLGIVKEFTEVPQLLETSDAQSAAITPFEINESAERYFDNNRINKYQIVNTLSGLTNKETYLLTNFINYIPENIYDPEEYHAQYSYRQFGLQQGDEFIIPGSAIRKVTTNENLPGYKNNQLGTKNILAVAPENINVGTVITTLQNNYYNGSTITANPYDDYATTIIVHNNQLLDGQPITGKIFVNCVEDGYTFSREEYNKARIQNFDPASPDETVGTALWQYSTRRLNRKPQKINIRQMTEYGQTTPTDGGGGAFIQAPSNASNGIIRSETDKNNTDYQSDLYPTVEEEIYTTTQIPVLSMTWLGMEWLLN